MSLNKLNVIILTAGHSSRMLSDIPKSMYQIAGKFMVQHLIDAVTQMQIQSIYIVYNYNNKQLMQIIHSNNTKIPIYWVLQDIPKGTGHAVQQVLPMINENNSEVLILYGDVPLVSCNTLKKLQCIKSQCDISLLTADIINPKGYGRIIRNNHGNVTQIIEDSDIINIDHKKITEINSGIFITVIKKLKHWLKQITYKNVKHELYLTDIINLAYHNNCSIQTVHPDHLFEIIGINNKLDLIQAERIFQKEQAKQLLKLGVIISDPNRFDLRGTLSYGKDVHIDINVIMEGNVSLGDRVKIGSNCILKNVVIENDVIIYPFSIIEDSKINFKSKIGPFTRLRPGTQLKEKTCIGNFVELKNTQIGKKSKVNHLSYLGDSDIGSGVNIGAGTIICNYDGTKKNHTYIGDNAFIGADSQLIAPIKIGKNAIIGAGTTVTADVAEGETIISRIRQFPILNKKNSNK